MSAVMEALMVSASVVDDYIASWRRARLSSDQGKLYYPRINILHAAYYPAGESDHEPMDDPAAETVQRIVDDMPEGVRTSFEAHHLGIIRQEYCRDKEDPWRANALAITYDEYKARYKQGWFIIRDRLEKDKSHD